MHGTTSFHGEQYSHRWESQSAYGGAPGAAKRRMQEQERNNSGNRAKSMVGGPIFNQKNPEQQASAILHHSTPNANANANMFGPQYGRPMKPTHNVQFSTASQSGPRRDSYVSQSRTYTNTYTGGGMYFLHLFFCFFFHLLI